MDILTKIIRRLGVPVYERQKSTVSPGSAGKQDGVTDVESTQGPMDPTDCAVSPININCIKASQPSGILALQTDQVVPSMTSGALLNPTLRFGLRRQMAKTWMPIPNKPTEQPKFKIEDETESSKTMPSFPGVISPDPWHPR